VPSMPPFFVTRFRETLFHYSALFDMLETLVPREDWERMLIEKEIFGREALNVIAREGWERMKRPETYKQWQVRNVPKSWVCPAAYGSLVYLNCNTFSPVILAGSLCYNFLESSFCF
jgi:hypothetical protein